jgi:capsular exopolysaccharide synthesis family protein
VGSDVRKPKLNEYLKLNTKLGLCHYLNDNSLQVKDIIAHYKTADFDVIHSGVIPPNPSELLLNGRFEGVLSYGKLHYDYVIVDTSPVNQVTDTLLLGHHADLFIYVIRANYVDKRLLKTPKMLADERRLPNLAVLLNDVNVEKEGYTYGYGYGKTESKKSWWKF